MGGKAAGRAGSARAAASRLTSECRKGGLVASLKYFDGILAAQQADSRRPPGPLPAFAFASLGSRNPLARWFTRFLLRRLLPFLTAILRFAWPNPRFGRTVLVTRRADVEAVLGDMDRFAVVYGLEMRELGAGANNVLGLDGAEHDELLAALRRSLTAADTARVGTWVREDAAALLEAGGGRIDVMRDLVTRTAAEASCRLFGITAHDPDLFAEWTMAVSNQLFGDFFGNRAIRTQAQTAAAHLRAVIDDAINRVETANREHPDAVREHVTVIDRLITDERMPRAHVRAAVLGLITAFMPTNTLAAGNMLEVLSSRPALMRMACAAARADDRRALRDILLEAGRLNPALSPGLWRHVPAGATPGVIGAGRRGQCSVGPGDLVLACIPSALRDRQRDKARDAGLMFGHGPHACLGAQLALTHLVSVFGALLRQDGLARARGRDGRMFRVGPFPTRCDMTYRAPRARRSLMILTFPVRRGIARTAVEAALDALQNPVRPDVRVSLDRTGRVQSASLSVIERASGSEDSVLILEISGDGEDGVLLDLVARECFAWLGPLFALCAQDGAAPAAPDALAHILKRGHRRLHRWPWGATGLHFDGLPELSVADIERQERVARFAHAVVDQHSRDLGLSTRAMDILLRTRRLLARDNLCALPGASPDLAMAAPERASIIKPSRKRLGLAEWKRPGSIFSPLPRMLIGPGGRPVLAALLVAFTAWTAVFAVWLLPIAHGLTVRTLAAVACILAGAVVALLTAAALTGFFLALIRMKEKREPVDDRAPGRDQVEALARREDARGFAQNHIVAVMTFKPGLVRRFSFAFAMWGIKQAVTYWFRPGFVVTMGTIHKARWFRVPGTSQFVFFSNFDGSWESYLEDFITRAHEGQSAAWSHGVGFPSTRFLILDGARDGDRFKRWVRLQQRETRCWYSRFPHLPAHQIRRNAIIEDGLARATSDTDARRWPSQFGSAPRERDELETQEAQTLIFSGFGRQKEASALFLRLPKTRQALAGWLQAVTGLRAQPLSALLGPPRRWLVPLPDGSERIQLALEARVRFGEQTVDGGGSALGLTAAGLERAGLAPDCGLHSLPVAFRMSMARRAAILGDESDAMPDWRVSDDPQREDAAEAVLLIYGHEPGLTHQDLVAAHRELMNHFLGSTVHEIPCTPVPDECGRPNLDREHFGFRDGISQPAIRGTRRASAPVPERDMLPAGEFLLGYRNMQGFVSPAMTLGAEHDPANDLPILSAAESDRYPQFRGRCKDAGLRDFGRNGCFVAVRQLDQDVAAFRLNMARAADELQARYPGLAELAEGAVSGEWLAAKIIGRRPDGSPLVGYGDGRGGHSYPHQSPNDFAYGTDDPRGLACPLGAHIRRANPRDSQEPGDADEQRITNRHRLLRRGRSYAYEGDGAGKGTRTGLLFIALCADLERQFEFVQRTWLNATSFHGLVEERDPLLGGPAAGPSDEERSGDRVSEAEGGGFTIPTAVGPVRVEGLQSWVTLRGGGYFFLPSRSAFAFLINRSTRLSDD